MSERELEPLDPKLEALFARERTSHRPEPRARAAVEARIESTIRWSKLSAIRASGAGASRAAKLVALAWMGGVAAAGFAAGRATAPAPRATVASDTATAPVASAVPSRRDDVHVPAPQAPSETAHTSPAPTTTRSAPPASTSASADALQKEQELIDTARGALARGRAEDALAATAAHAQRFPHGKLAEEREVLAIQALVLGGNRDAARLRAAAFRAAYPTSIFRPAIERALRAMADGGDSPE